MKTMQRKVQSIKSDGVFYSDTVLTIGEMRVVDLCRNVTGESKNKIPEYPERKKNPESEPD